MKTLYLLLCAAALAVPAVAVEGQKSKTKGADALSPACNADVEKLCKDVVAGGGSALMCLKERGDELSDGCRASFAKKKKELLEKNPALNACAADMKQFCSDEEPGGGRIVACMKAHKDEVSPACRAFMAKKAAAEGKKKK